MMIVNYDNYGSGRNEDGDDDGDNNNNNNNNLSSSGSRWTSWATAQPLAPNYLLE